jgi:ParB family chromosome partitioning protein
MSETEAEEEDGIKPLSERLISELTAVRTLALRDALANNPHVALSALLTSADTQSPTDSAEEASSYSTTIRTSGAG